MAGESQKVPSSEPDPTVLTTDAIARARTAERDYVNSQIAILVERFNANDEATKVLSETVNRTPTEIQKEVGHLKELMNNRFAAIDSYLSQMEVKTKEQREDAKAEVENALRAARELVQLQTQTFSDAIARTETTFTKQIEAQALLLQKDRQNNDEKIGDLKDRVGKIESVKQGATEQHTDNRAAMAFAITVGFFVLAIVGFIITQVATTTTP